MAERVDNPLRTFATKVFMRFMQQMGAKPGELWDSLQGECDADLGGGVMKYRIARPGEGNRGGGRAIVAVRKAERMVLMFGFEKKDLATIKPDELKAFRKSAKEYFAYSDDQMNQLVKAKVLTEIKSETVAEAVKRSNQIQ